MRVHTLVFLVAAAAACRGGSVADPEPAAAPAAPRATRPHRLQPVELILRGRPEVGVQLGRLAVHGAAWLALDGEPESSPGWNEVVGTEVAVAEVRGDRLRILHDEDDVRLLVWIARGDLARVAIRDVELGAGVLVRAGTPISGDTIVADGLMVKGTVDAEAIGDLWDAAAWPGFDGTTHTLDTGLPIRAEPAATGAVVATPTEPIEVRPLGPEVRGWREVETLGPHLIVRGHVETWHLDGLGTIGHGSGSGYGSSHSISLDVPAGTCLYDAIGGEMIGITTAARSRLAHRTEDAAWYHLLVNSPWGLLDIPIHDGDAGWDRCADL